MSAKKLNVHITTGHVTTLPIPIDNSTIIIFNCIIYASITT